MFESMFLPKNFIKATEAFTTFDRAVPAPYIRKSFTVDAPCTAKLTVAACGFYEVFLNGKRYTKGFLAPYISNPDHYIYCDEYEVPLDGGENVLGFLLGNGFQNNPGGYIWDFDKAPYRSAPQVALSLTYQNSEGQTVKLESDGSFKTAPSPILRDDYRFGEVYDARREIDGWCEKGFDDSAWENVLVVSPAEGDLEHIATAMGITYKGLEPRGELRVCDAPPIVLEKEMKPVSVTRTQGGWLYDFGECNAGVCRLSIRGSAGQTVTLTHADSLREDGSLEIQNIWFKNYWDRDSRIVHKDVYTLKGEGEEIYTPTFTYHGFRYVLVEGITEEQAVPGLLTYLVYHSDLKTRGGFICSDETVNKLQEMTQRSDLSNFYYFPTDCPQREKNGWTADAALSSEHVLLNFDAEKSYREWQRNICKAQDGRGALPGIVPSGGWGFVWGNGPAWDSVLAYLPYFVYIYRGETDMIIESAPAFMKYLHYLTTRTDEDGLIHIGLGDWCPVDGGEPKAPLELTDSVMAMDIANKISVLFDAVNMPAQRDFAKCVAEQFKAAVRRHLIDFGTMTVAGNCQTSQAMCIYYGVFTETEAGTAFQRLLEMVHEKDDHLDVGVLGGRVLFHVLTKFGCTELALKMIARPDYPSYGNWIARGATTLWENFDPVTVSSTNHHFWGDISAWFIKILAGIRFNPNGNDIRKVDLRPSFVSALDFAEGWYEAPDGRIVSRWEKQGDEILFSVEVPENVRATLFLENGYVLENGLAFAPVKTGQYKVCRK